MSDGKEQTDSKSLKDPWKDPENEMPEPRTRVLVYGKNSDGEWEFCEDEWIWRDWSNDGDPDQAWLGHSPVKAWRHLPEIY